MAKTVNFNRHRPPILRVPLTESLVLHVTPPTVDLQEELRARRTELSALLSKDDEDMRVALWDLAARLMSCNRNLRTITAEELRTTYELDEADLAVFYDDYAAFLSDLETAKN